MSLDSYTLCIDKIQHDGGYGWYIKLPEGFHSGDQVNASAASPFVLHEDSLALLYPHSKHNDIRIIGTGHYSHWDGGLYFSTTDNTDPRLNGRKYRLSHPKHPVYTIGHSSNDDSRKKIAPERIRTLFIIGCGRSGTTILGDIIKTLPQIRATHGHPHGEDNEGWIQHAGAIISGGAADVSLDHNKKHIHACQHMTAQDALPENINSMRQYYANEILQGKYDLTVLNKNIHICNKIGFVKAIFPSAKFVHIIRDAVPTIASWKKIMLEKKNMALHLPDTEFPCLSMMPINTPSPGGKHADYQAPSLETLINYWCQINRNIPKQFEQYPQDLLTIKYESLSIDPNRCLSDICRFADLPLPPKLPEWMNISLAQTHESMLTDNDIQHIRKSAQQVLEQFGYHA